MRFFYLNLQQKIEEEGHAALELSEGSHGELEAVDLDERIMNHLPDIFPW